jgi:hypothetical protein
MNNNPQQAINDLISTFFGIVDNRDGKKPDLAQLGELFMDGAVITKRNGNDIEVMSLETFIEPRQPMLTNGTLTEFHEWVSEQRTVIEGGIATHICKYEKAGILKGEPYSGSGRKHIQLVLTEQGWKIAAIIWEDE